MLYIGLDPGVGGGIAVVDAEGRFVRACRMPETGRDVIDLLRGMPDARAVLEKVSASPKMGVVSAWTFGRHYERLQMGLLAAGISFDEVPPNTWQKSMGCLQPKGKDRGLGTKDKNITKRRAQALFPAVVVTHAIADALLLAEYARRRECWFSEAKKPDEAPPQRARTAATNLF